MGKALKFKSPEQEKQEKEAAAIKAEIRELKKSITENGVHNFRLLMEYVQNQKGKFKGFPVKKYLSMMESALDSHLDRLQRRKRNLKQTAIK